MGFWTLFRYALRGRLVQMLAWGLSLMLLAVYLVQLHDAFISQQEQFNSMLSAYPPELMAFFGGTQNLFIPSGFLHFTFFSYVAILLGFMAVSAGSGLLAADEERGTLELVVAHPASRLSVFLARLLALVVGMLVILALAWIGFVVASPGTGLAQVKGWEYALPHGELLAFMLFFGGLALLLSQVLPSRGAAYGVSAALLLGSYVMKVLVDLDQKLVQVERFSPLHYVKGGYAIEGLNLGWLLGLLGGALLFIILAAWRFERRDLRISGEGNWPEWLKKAARKPRAT